MYLVFICDGIIGFMCCVDIQIVKLLVYSYLLEIYIMSDNINSTDDCLSQMDYYLVGRENYTCDDVYFDSEYIRLGKTLLDRGEWVMNSRTGKRCLTHIGGMMEFDLSCGNMFPLLTTKKVFYKPMIAELLGFIRGFDNAKDFRDLGCNIWNANANESIHWLENPNRTGDDDLGRIYGVQARSWRTEDREIDQLGLVVKKITARVDDRRLIVSHWNPGELNQMALPPCHLLYQFSIVGDKLHLTMYQRSADYPLGVPFNIASYALLLRLVAQITGMKVGKFVYFLNNIHIYEDQLEMFREQMERDPHPSPNLMISKSIETLEDLESWVTVEHFCVSNYTHHDNIAYPFSE